MSAEPQGQQAPPTFSDVVVQQLLAMRQQIDAMLCLVATGRLSGAASAGIRPGPRVETVENYRAFGKDEPPQDAPPRPPITNSVDALEELARRVKTPTAGPTAGSTAGEDDAQSA